MGEIVEVRDVDDPRLADFRDLTVADRRPDRPGGRGLVIAEGVTVVYVLSRPSPEWTGERGHIDAALLERLLPQERDGLQFFICGPESMMDAAEAAALAAGAAPQSVHSERFAMA